jgi:hypothetical protein
MISKNSTYISSFILLCFICFFTNCKEAVKVAEENKTVYPSDVMPIFQHFNLVLGDGSNSGDATSKEYDQFFYTENDGNNNWVVYKTPNAGNTHGTSNNTRTELAQVKKWSPMTDAKLSATLKVMNV